MPLSVGIGLAVGLLCTELFGIASGGLIVPGYIALYIDAALHVVATLAVALATYAVVRLLSTFLIVYGRRRTALMILIGYILGMLVSQWSGLWVRGVRGDRLRHPRADRRSGWTGRSVLQTLASLALVSVIVRLILVLTVGAELDGHEEALLAPAAHLEPAAADLALVAVAGLRLRWRPSASRERQPLLQGEDRAPPGWRCRPSQADQGGAQQARLPIDPEVDPAQSG